MRIFLTGATGFIGSAIVPDLIAAGHQVLGLTRSDAGAAALRAAGAEPHRGDLEDLPSLRDGAAGCDGVIHTAFDHDFSRFAANCEKDGRAIAALGDALAGSARPLLITSGVGMGQAARGELATEDGFDTDHPTPRKASELAGRSVAACGVTVVAVRLPQVHDARRQGLVTPLVALARATGVSAHVGDGLNRWPAAHVSDTARLYRLALETAVAGGQGGGGGVYNAVAEEGVPVRDIAGVIARGLKVPVAALSPEEAIEHFGWLAAFVGWDMPASGAWTRDALGWRPTGPGLLADLEAMDYRGV